MKYFNQMFVCMEIFHIFAAKSLNLSDMKELQVIQSKLKAPKGNYNKGKDVPNDVKTYITKFFHYNPINGAITRFDRKNSNGSLDKDGYLILKIKQQQYKAHRLAWFLYYGDFPQKEIDHINRNRTDNRIANLREVDRIDNILNTKKQINKDTGVVGVYVDKKTKGLKKKYTTRYKGRTMRFYTVTEAISFRKTNKMEV